MKLLKTETVSHKESMTRFYISFACYYSINGHAIGLVSYEIRFKMRVFMLKVAFCCLI
jgi:hypothetical protein